MSEPLSLSDIGFDIENLKQTLATQGITDISKQITDDVIITTKFETAELVELKQSVKQIYLIDLSKCELVTEAWVKGLNNMIICTSLENFNYEEQNKGRFEKGLTELIPDTALSIKIKINNEMKALFIGYMDSCQAYALLANYVSSIKNASLYREINGQLEKLKITDLSGVRVHI